jgi:hypothetical protein
MWRKIDISALSFERLVGFSIPVYDSVVVISYDEVQLLKIRLGYILQIENVQIDRNGIFPFNICSEKKKSIDINGVRYDMLGIFGGNPVVSSAKQDILSIDPHNQRLIARDVLGQEILSFPYNDLSGDWQLATFSADSKYIILGMPYELHIWHQDS